MPTIKKLEKKKRPERKETDMRKLRQTAYQNKHWRKLRDTYLKEHPVCEECLKKGRVTPAQDVHHIKSPFKGGEINYNLLLDYHNLESLCKDCHGLLHSQMQGHKPAEKIIEELDELFKEFYEDDNK